MSEAEVVDVVVVGAGLAGLTAALQLRRIGHSVRVLEASDRVGGRVLGAEIGDGQVIELGGQFVGPTQNHILALIEKLGLSTYPTHVAGDHIYFRLGTRTRYDATGGPIPPESDRAIGQLLTTISELQNLAAEVSPDRPWEAPHAAELDAHSFQDWMDRYVDDPAARLVIEYVVRGTNTCEPAQLSLLHMASYVAAAGDEDHPGSILRVVVTADGASMFRIEGGSQRIPLLLAAKLRHAIRLSSPVTHISQDDHGVTVGAGTTTIHAQRVVVATPPAMAADIRFDPPLPERRIHLAQRLLRGSQIKANVVFDQPFWRDEGLSGYVLSDRGPVQNVWDNTPAAGSPGVLVCFIKGDAARELDNQSPESVEKAIIDNLTDYFGERAAEPRQILLKRWHTEPWIRGCPGSLAPPGLLTSCGPALREPVGRVHWAGTETATYWQGFMDGAIASGDRVAAEVSQELVSQHSLTK
ncbi:flavin monoamine oxidase family protein [Antrihabitans cavernicola]|uniref:Flavin monoamine oxidase family protein n=1 Tax=Antrihabitans cavernicola TaxID=2495913 RepID=A0A5A7S706_9NOCA|nr:flavin monoamine oxidase family protein [Spelaeibacter cavernicola]KAA0017032.1 flavin monoamine oxidase family protein [Spelaeibacter cavernicola]